MDDLFKKVHDDLPIFQIDRETSMILYTPGHFLTYEHTPADKLITMLKNPENINDFNVREGILKFLEIAQLSVDHWNSKKRMPFSPECITIHVGSDCSLNCFYCYSKLEKTNNKNLSGFPDLNAIKALFQYVAETGKKETEKITVVYHGSGEPTFHWQQLINAHKSILSVAAQYNIQLFTYIATNGNLITPQVDWLVENINLIGISCDGPPEIQNMQRAQGVSHSPPIEEVCQRILEKGGQFDIRVTITKDTIARQQEIVKYLVEKCKAKNIRIEPVYLAGEDVFREDQAETFFTHFFNAKEYAASQGVNWDYSGVRLQEFHGAYCDVMRNTLRLTPDGFTRNCFCYIKNEPEYITGRYNKELDLFKLNDKIQELKSEAARIPEKCDKTA